MIVIEGCDGTGKTTLANQLCLDVKLKMGLRLTRNRDCIWKEAKEDVYTALSKLVRGTMPPQVWDRFGAFSDPIYSRVTDRDPQFNQQEIIFISSILKAARCPIIICNIPLEVAQENAEKVHQMDGVKEYFPYIHGKYEGLIMAMRDWPNTHSYDYRVEGAYQDLVSKVIVPYITKRKDREWRS